MGRSRTWLCALAAALASLAAVPASSGAQTSSFSNPSQIHIPGITLGPATPYPSSISLTGLSETITNTSVQLPDVDSGGNSDELDLVLVGPNGQKVMLWSDACGLNAIANGSFVFDDSATSLLSDAGPCPSGTYRPSNYVGNAPEPDNISMGGGPAPPYGSQLAAFFGASPNGTWSLYAFSDTAADYFDINGWVLTLAILPPPTSGPTGQRAAALAKCKKKKRRKARRKCRRRAQTLPL